MSTRAKWIPLYGHFAQLRGNWAYYTVEPFEIVIRGYGYEIDHEPLDDFDGGGFYADNAWSLEDMKRA